MLSRQLFAPVLSLMLPGSGALYQGRYGASAAHFCVFVAACLTTGGTRWLFLVAAASAIDTFRSAPRRDAARRFTRRETIYFVVGAAGIASWMAMLGAAWLPAGGKLSMNMHVDRFSRFVRECARRLGEFPAGIERCGGPPEGWDRDPWGRKLQYELEAERFRVRSDGEDGRPGTTDDANYRFKR